MKREFSAGGIVFNKEGQVLLVQNSSMKIPGKSYWGLPKGKIENGESSQEAALREVEEETGVKARVLLKIGDSKYVYPFEGEKIFKVVIIYQMEYLSGELHPQESELSDAKWFNPDQALTTLSFKNDKDLLKKALEMRQNPSPSEIKNG